MSGLWIENKTLPFAYKNVSFVNQTSDKNSFFRESVNSLCLFKQYVRDCLYLCGKIKKLIRQWKY